MADRHCLFLGGPLGQGSDDLLKSPLLDAIGAQYGKTPAQVALRWLIERGIVAFLACLT